jgi:spoIIIJ-associated protein
MTEQEAAETSLQVEAEGETVGEAKWTAVRELERRFPGIDKANVRFVVLSEGERGLLGVGFTPARVIASVSGPMASPAAAEEPGSPAALLRELLERVAGALGAPVAITIREDDETMVATLTGPDLGLVIGKHGQTIDAIQYLANAILWRGAEDRTSVVGDAAG